MSNTVPTFDAKRNDLLDMLAGNNPALAEKWTEWLKSLTPDPAKDGGDDDVVVGMHPK